MSLSTHNKVQDKMICLISQQTSYIDQLKKEKDVLSSELKAFKNRLQDVVEENENLYDDMQGKIVSHTIDRSHNILDDSVQTSENLIFPTTKATDISFDPTSDKNVSQLWKKEMIDLKKMYESKVAALETQIAVTENSLKEALVEAEALRNQLSKVNLPKNFILQKPEPQKQDLHLETSLPIIERLTKERDELLKTVTSLRSSLSLAQTQEAELRQEIQKSFTVLEDVQLEKTQMQVERDQAKIDYQNICLKLNKEIEEGHKRSLDASLKQRQACFDEIESLQQKIGELMATCFHYENDLEKSAKEKSTILIQLDESRTQLLQTEKQLASVKAEVEHEVRSALKGYSAAERELADAKSKLQEELLKTQQEKTRFEQDTKELHQRLKDAENHSLKTQQLNVTLTEEVHKVQTENGQLKHKVIELTDSFSKQSKKLQLLSSNKIEDLQATLDRVQIEYEKRLGDLEEISQKQSKLIGQLRQECNLLENALNNLGQKHRVEVGKLTQQYEQARTKAVRLDKQNKELSQQCVDHGKVHAQMQERLLEVNNRARLTTNQVLELLDQHNQDSKVNDVLNKEVLFLHSSLMHDPPTKIPAEHL